ncbi:hypothetical protein ACP4OV_018789 [Aristida adscensionis]
MAPSSFLIALLVALAVQPSAAARAAHGEAAAAAPAPGGGGAVVVANPSSATLLPLIPCSLLPDIPFLRDIFHLICYDPTPPPKPCRPALAAMAAPCAAFLTAGANATPAAPPRACCDGYFGVINDEPLCLCHIGNGDIAQLLPAPVNMTRVFALPRPCGSALRLEDFATCEDRMVLRCRRWILLVLRQHVIWQERQRQPEVDFIWALE